MEKLLLKYIKGEASVEEQEKIIKWLDEDPSHFDEYRSMRKLYTISLWSVKENVDRQERQASLKHAKNQVQTCLYEFLKIASVLLLGIFGTYMFMNTKSIPVKMQQIYVPVGQRAEVVLSDGTKVWLNSRTTLRYSDHFTNNARNIELDGEGYFEVARNEKAPFTVHTKSYDVKVLGTEFNLRAYKNSNQFATSLLKGSVDVIDRSCNKSVRLKPKEMLYQKNGILHKKGIDDFNYFRWREGLFCFDNETIGGLIKKMELFYDVQVIVKKESLTNYKYSGKFRIEDGIEHVLKVLQLRHKFTYSRNEEGNLIIIE